VHGFLHPQSHIVHMFIFLAFLDSACAHDPCVVLAHANFITGCIVLDLLEMNFWSTSELMDVLNMLDSCIHLQMKFW
jgi:hypothetical protein